jgi:galactitol-specific phosphotransferase system IIC component
MQQFLTLCLMVVIMLTFLQCTSALGNDIWSSYWHEIPNSKESGDFCLT